MKKKYLLHAYISLTVLAVNAGFDCTLALISDIKISDIKKNCNSFIQQDTINAYLVYIDSEHILYLLKCIYLTDW